ncbi:hypothetical protein C8R44DRAFT_749275 [Mycena epipterygia]|nr:hypothetical protein C8R44DRAFT_749275 [Mycena epipterygia]
MTREIYIGRNKESHSENGVGRGGGGSTKEERARGKEGKKERVRGRCGHDGNIWGVERKAQREMVVGGTKKDSMDAPAAALGPNHIPASFPAAFPPSAILAPSGAPPLARLGTTTNRACAAWTAGVRGGKEGMLGSDGGSKRKMDVSGVSCGDTGRRK